MQDRRNSQDLENQDLRLRSDSLLNDLTLYTPVKPYFILLCLFVVILVIITVYFLSSL